MAKLQCECLTLVLYEIHIDIKKKNFFLGNHDCSQPTICDTVTEVLVCEIQVMITSHLGL